MQPLTGFELYLNWFVAVVMPLIIIANLIRQVRETDHNAYLWRDHASFMWTSLVVVGLLAMWSMVRLAAHYGVVSDAAVDTAVPVIGIPFLIAAVVEIWLVVKFLRSRRRAA